MGKDPIKQVGDDLKQVGEDLKEFAREEKQRIFNEDPHEKIKEELEKEGKEPKEFVPSTGLTSEGRLRHVCMETTPGGKYVIWGFNATQRWLRLTLTYTKTENILHDGCLVVNDWTRMLSRAVAQVAANLCL